MAELGSPLTMILAMAQVLYAQVPVLYVQVHALYVQVHVLYVLSGEAAAQPW